MGSLFYLCCSLAALFQLSSGQVFSPVARNLAAGIGNLGGNNAARNIGGLGFGARGGQATGTLIASNDASSSSGKVSGTIGTRIAPANYEFGTFKSRLNKDFGLQVTSDGLEVEGTLAVNGKMPLVATVEVNGSVPSEGTASVNYGCGGSGNVGNKLS